mgnify:CR=1 FL=1
MRVNSLVQDIFVEIFANPFVCYILLMLGIYLLLFGIASPGMGMEVAGVICLALAIVGIVIIGIDIAAVVLFIVGIVLFIVEAQTEGSLHGIFSFGGIICIITGGIIFLQSLSVNMGEQEIIILYTTLITFTVCLSVIFGGITWKVIESKKRGPTESFLPKPGDIGIVKSEQLKPSGQVFVKGETWTAECIDGYWPVFKNEKIIVEKVEGVRLIVRPLNIDE